MKKKLIIISLILLISIMVAGGTMAWFASSPDADENEFKMGTVKVEVIEEGLINETGIKVGSYDKRIQVRSLGTKNTFVRVRLVPEWSEASLPVSNVQLNLGSTNDWFFHIDGYYYFKYYLSQGQETSLLLESLNFTDLTTEYEGKAFTLKIVAEGVQITNEAWKDVWGVTTLPFIPDLPWTP